MGQRGPANSVVAWLQVRLGSCKFGDLPASACGIAPLAPAKGGKEG